MGYEPHLCDSEGEARALMNTLPKKGSGHVFLTQVIQPEKKISKSFTENEVLDMARFKNLGVIKNKLIIEKQKLNLFEEKIAEYKRTRNGKNLKLLIYLIK